MSGAVAGALISQAGNLAGTIMTNASNERIHWDDNAFNSTQALIARNWQEKMRASQYQTQMKDMVAAGLNPALMYGNSVPPASATPSATPASSAPPIAMHAPDFSALGNLAMQMAQIRNLDADTYKKREETSWIAPAEQARIDSLRQQIKNGQISAKLGNAQIESITIDNAFKRATFDANTLTAITQSEIYQKNLKKIQSEEPYWDETAQKNFAILCTDAGLKEAQLDSFDFSNGFTTTYGTAESAGWSQAHSESHDENHSESIGVGAGVERGIGIAGIKANSGLNGNFDRSKSKGHGDSHSDSKGENSSYSKDMPIFCFYDRKSHAIVWIPLGKNGGKFNLN